MLGNEEAACDAMQEVFIRVLKNRKRMIDTHPSALLFRIATNICLNRIRDDRHRNLRNNLNFINNLDYFGNEEDRTTAKILLEFILEKEKGFTRTIAVMYFINGMTIKEISSFTNLSISGVHKNLAKLKGRLKLKGEVS